MGFSGTAGSGSSANRASEEPSEGTTARSVFLAFWASSPVFWTGEFWAEEFWAGTDSGTRANAGVA